jgi:prepilin-type N-terminal cleavage/methylation domain-containing protein
MKNQSQSGVTLIEILIAVSLLSLLTAGILVTMHLGLNTMDKTDSRLVHNRKVVNSRKIIESELDGFRASVAAYHAEGSPLRMLPFFQAEPQSMRFVSAFSLEDASRGKLQILSLQVIPGEQNQGVRLIVNEIPYTGPLEAGQLIASLDQDPITHRQITRYAPILPGPQSFVLADRLRYCRFWYLEPLLLPPFQNWRQDWIQNQIYPLGVRIEMAPLDVTPTDLHVTTVTMKFNISAVPGMVYADGQ